MDSKLAGEIVGEVQGFTADYGSKVVARVRLNEYLRDEVLERLFGKVTGLTSLDTDAQGFIKLRAATPISEKRARQLTQQFLRVVADHLSPGGGRNVISIDRGRSYRNLPSGMY